MGLPVAISESPPGLATNLFSLQRCEVLATQLEQTRAELCECQEAVEALKTDMAKVQLTAEKGTWGSLRFFLSL